MTEKEAIGIWLPMVLTAVHDSPQCEEAVKMAGRALAAMYDIRSEIAKNGNSDMNDQVVLSIIDKHIEYVRGAE